MFFLDPIDRKLIRLLKKNARMKVVALARELGLSRSATHDRVVRLETRGVIERYTININAADEADARALLFIHFEEFASGNNIAPEIKNMEGVDSAFCLAGSVDMVIKAECARNADMLQLRERIIQLDGIKAVHTHTIMAGQ